MGRVGARSRRKSKYFREWVDLSEPAPAEAPTDEPFVFTLEGAYDGPDLAGGESASAS